MAGKEVGIIGLGKMGKNIALQMLEKGYYVTAYNRSDGPLQEVAAKGAHRSGSVKELVGRLKAPRTIWLMLTSGEVTIQMTRELAKYCGNADTIIDGSNSFYKESVMLHDELAKKGIDYLDAGCSGGPSGALKGMCIMAGGEKRVFEKNERLLRDLCIKNGLLYTGSAGSGHFTKMVHNAIEYGMMEAISEGLDLIENSAYSEVDKAKLCALWNNGSVIRSYLVELAARALEKDAHLSSTAPYVEDNGEGRWAVKEAIDRGIPFGIITDSLYTRFDSRSEKKFGKRMLAALRYEFGGHAIKKE